MGRRRLSTGEVGIPGSGDTVNAGGEKLRDNFDELYNAFGNQNLANVFKTEDEEYFSVHPSGYYQTYPLDFYDTEVPIGTMHNIDSTRVENLFQIKLPEIIDVVPTDNPNKIFARVGEHIKLIDTTGTWGTNAVRLIPYAGNTVDGKLDYVISDPSKIVDIVATKNKTWKVRVVSYTGTVGRSVIEKSFVINAGVPESVALGNTQSFDVVKLMIYAEEYNATSQSTIAWSSSEALIMIGDVDILSTRYAVTETKPIVNISYQVIDGVFYAIATPVQNINRVTVSIASIEVVNASNTARTPINKAFNINWTSGGTVSSQYDITWTHANYATKALDVNWSYTSPVSNTTDLEFGIRKNVNKTKNLEWDLGNVVSSRTNINFGVKGRVISLSSLKYQVKSNVNKNLVVDYGGNNIIVNHELLNGGINIAPTGYNHIYPTNNFRTDSNGDGTYSLIFNEEQTNGRAVLSYELLANNPNLIPGYKYRLEYDVTLYNVGGIYSSALVPVSSTGITINKTNGDISYDGSPEILYIEFTVNSSNYAMSVRIGNGTLSNSTSHLKFSKPRLAKI